MTKIKKIVAIITTFTFLFTAAGPAMATTIAELQAQIADLLTLISSLTTQLNALQGAGTGTVTGCAISSFDRSLKTGMSGDDVKCLQIVLNTDSATQVAPSGVGSPGNETSYFGPLTTAAVIKFQEKYASEILATYGLTSGTGYVGTTTKAKLNSLLSTGAGAGTGEVGTAAIVSLAVDTPVASQTARNAQDVVFTKVKFSAGATAYTVSTVNVKRGGVAADTDISAIKLYDGATQLGSTQALNTTTHKASFTGLNWTIPAYSVKYLTIKGSIGAVGTATVGNSIKLGIYAATDITASVTPSGTFPIWSNGMTIAGISVGRLFVTKRTSPATTTILSGAVDQEIACWNFTASSTEGFSVRSIKISQVGTASREDLSNLKLKVSGVQIGSTIAQFDTSNRANFDLSSSPLDVIVSATKVVCAFSDISSGVWTERTAKFEITQYTDVVAYGSNSGGAVTIRLSDATVYSKQTGNRMTIGQGTLTVAIDASENPSAQTYVRGTTNRLITSLKFSTGSVEGARITSIRLTLGGSSVTATDISNVSLWDGTTLISTASVIGSYATFGPGIDSHSYDASGLFDLEASTVKTILVKADIPTGANILHTVSLSVAANSIWADGLNSQYDLPSAAITGTADGNAHNIAANGNLAVSLSSLTPAAQDFVIGATGKEFIRINLTADSGEDIDVTSIILDLFSYQKAATTSAHFINVKLIKEDGSQFGITSANPIATANFSGTLTVSASETVVLKAIGDIPSSGYPNPTGSMSVASTTDIANALTSTGRASSVDIVETGVANGKLMSIGSGTVIVTAAATPGDQTLIAGATQIAFVDLVFSAGTAENVRITRIKLNSATTNLGTTTDVAHIALYDGATRLTAKKSLTASTSVNHYVVFSSSDFLNSSGISITKGQQKRITVKADVPSTAVTAHTIAFGIAHIGNVTFVGLSSNTTPDPTITPLPGNLTGANYIAGASGDAALRLVTLAEKGTLTISTTADTPIAAIQSVSKAPTVVTGIAFHKSRFAATYEDIDIKSISVTRSSGDDADFAYITLWDGSTQLGSAQSLSNGSSTFNFATEDYWRIPAGGAKYLTIKADLNGIKSPGVSGASTGDDPALGVDTVTAEGVASGVSPNNAGVQDKIGNTQYLRQSEPTIALASPTSGTYGAGTQELIRWTVSASPYGSIGWEKVVFDVSGSVIITSGGSSYTVGSSPDAVQTDGIYMSTTTSWGDAVGVQLIAVSSMQIWDVDSNTQVDGTTTDAFLVDQATATGTARVSFVPSAEQQVSIGTTKTYKLLGTIQQGSGQLGTSLLTKIASRSITAQSGAAYATVAGTTGVTFVWTDRSGAGGDHHAGSLDWTHDFKVSGISTPTKTLSK